MNQNDLNDIKGLIFCIVCNDKCISLNVTQKEDVKGTTFSMFKWIP